MPDYVGLNNFVRTPQWLREEVSAEGISSCRFRFFHSVVTCFELCCLLPVFTQTLWTWKKPSNCLCYNPEGETQVTGKVINPYYRSSLLFPMNISRTFITWLEGRKQKLVWFLHFVTITDCKKNISLPLRSYCTNPGLCGGTVSHVTNSSASAELFLHPNKSNFAARDDKFVKHLWEVVKQHATLGKNRLSSDIPHFGENLCFSAHAAKMLY